MSNPSSTSSTTPSSSATTSASNNMGSTSSTTSMSGSTKLSWSDKRFVTKAADDGQAEVQTAQLAATKAANADVREFAQKLVTDHTQVNSELMSLASGKGVTIDKDDGHDRAYNRLNKKSGSEFDQEFVEHMIDEHEKDIKLFEKASTEAKDSEVRAFASKHLGHLREHLQQAQNLRQSAMPTGRTDDSSGASLRRDANSPMSSSASGSSSTRSSSPSSGSERSTGASSTSGTPAGGDPDSNKRSAP